MSKFFGNAVVLSRAGKRGGTLIAFSADKVSECGHLMIEVSEEMRAEGEDLTRRCTPSTEECTSSTDGCMKPPFVVNQVANDSS